MNNPRSTSISGPHIQRHYAESPTTQDAEVLPCQLMVLHGHVKDVVHLRVPSGQNDGWVLLWDLDANLPVDPPIQHECEVDCVSISADGKLLVTCCGDNVLTQPLNGRTFVFTDCNVRSMLCDLKPQFEDAQFPEGFFDDTREYSHVCPVFHQSLLPQSFIVTVSLCEPLPPCSCPLNSYSCSDYFG